MMQSSQVERLVRAETGEPVAFGDELVLGGERVVFLDYLENLDCCGPALRLEGTAECVLPICPRAPS
ncbi:hypothetical protein [Streptomyces qinglanensis]|uniref:hypothetical protein n=1 Tax=Streptomyces qinglanensis TaxID=943816 RepID=UPI003D7138C9